MEDSDIANSDINGQKTEPVLPPGFDPFESTLVRDDELFGAEYVQAANSLKESAPETLPLEVLSSGFQYNQAEPFESQETQVLGNVPTIDSSASDGDASSSFVPVNREAAHDEALAFVMGQSYAQETQVLQPVQPEQPGQSSRFSTQPTQAFYPAQPVQTAQPGQPMDQECTHDEALAFVMNQSYAQEGAYVPAGIGPQHAALESEPAPKKKHTKLFVVLGILAVLLCACVGVAWMAHVSVHDYIAKIAEQNEQNAQALVEWELLRKVDLNNIPENGQKVETYGLATLGATEGEKDAHVQRIETLVSEYAKKGLISFEAYSLDGKSAICYNTELTHYSACTIKAPYIYWCCQQLEAGKGSLWDTMTLQPQYIFPGSGTIQYSAYGTAYSIADLIYYAMFISDNTAYNMLHAYFGGGDAYNEWVTSAGMPSLVAEGLWGYNIKASDLTKVWKLYYDYFQSSQSDVRNALYHACTNSYAAFACEHMPYTYSHKSGNTYYPDEQYNDAGIIWISGHPYCFAFLSKTEGEGWDSGVMCEIMNELSALMSKEDPQPDAPTVDKIDWTWDGWLDTVLPWRTPAASESE